MSFKVIKKDNNSKARIGILKTIHGEIETPVFMPVGTLASVKSLSSHDLTDMVNAQIILGNTYHLYLRPGYKLIERLGGLHKFMNWHKPILTDSGGFQVFSLAKLRKKTENGVEFQSHIDGSFHYFTPEKVMEIQQSLNSDIMMVFDDCIEHGADEKEIVRAMERTTRWAKECKQAKHNNNLLFGIIQGGISVKHRRAHVEEIVNIGFDGYALGGLSVGEPKEDMYKIVSEIAPYMPEDSPRYLMGVGTPEDILFAVENGIDMFDCVMPTRNARNGTLFTSTGKISIKKSEFKDKDEPLDEKCSCYTCKNYSKAYLRHLYVSRELSAYRLNTIHNLYFYSNLIKEAKKHIINGDFQEFRKNFSL